jgi:hypothetical protein
MLMVRRANMRHSIAAGRRIAKPRGAIFAIPERQRLIPKLMVLRGAVGPDYR